jgi:alkylation response protein AidB-like acyl-CoA dehydrogenase
MSKKDDSDRMPRDFGFGSDEEMLRDLAKKLLDEEMPIEKMRRLVAAEPETTYEKGERPGWDEALWKRCIELGWTGLAVPEEAGGVGVKMVGIVGLVEEVGRHALASPLVATLEATFVLREAGTPEAQAWLERIAEGASASLAITDRTGAWDPSKCDVEAEAKGDETRLRGQAWFVQDAFKADLFVVLARGEGGSRLCVVPADAPGLSIEQDHIHDLTRDQGTLRFEDVRVPAAGVVSTDGAEALRRAWPALLTTIAADLCGSSEWQLQTTAEYAKTRKQFDRPIGFFQAVKHPLVDAMVAIDRARSLVYHAACCIDSGSDEAEAAARMAKSAASDAGAYMSDRSVQLHGGIGFTWECDVHLYFKRSMHNQLLYGDGVHQRRWLADVLIGPVGAGAATAAAR